MKHLRQFETFAQFEVAMNNIERPLVAYSNDTKKVSYIGRVNEPTPPSGPLTKVWYKDGSYQEFDVTEIVQDKQTLSTTQFGDIMTIDKIYIGDGVTIGLRAFAGGEPSPNYDNFKHHTISSIIIGNNCEIKSRAFMFADKATEVIIGNNVIIGSEAFLFCKGLISVTILGGVTSIGNQAFSNCSSLTSITYKGVTYTSISALTNALTSNGVTVGERIFEGTALSD